MAVALTDLRCVVGERLDGQLHHGRPDVGQGIAPGQDPIDV